MELQGKIYRIDEVQNISATFTKREFILFIENEANIKWSNYINIQLTKDKCSLLDNLNVGNEVKVQINHRGRLWTNKEGKEVCFNSIEGWKIEPISNNTPTPQYAPNQSMDSHPSDPSTDLPF